MAAVAPADRRSAGAAAWFSASCYLGYAVVIGLALMADLAERPIWFDEACSYFQVADRDWATLLDSFGAGLNALPYAYFLVLWGVDQTLGLSPLFLRLPSALIGLLGLCLFHRLLARWRGHTVALLACATTLLLSERFIGYTHEARPYALYFLAAVLALGAGAAVVRTGGRAWWPLVANALAALALPAVHYVGLIYSGALAVGLLWALPRDGVGGHLRVAGSFIVGWGLFAAVQLPQVLLFIGGEPLLDPVLVRRLPFQVFYTAQEAFTLMPAPVPVILVLFMVLAWRRGDPPGFGETGPMASGATRFLLATAALWALLPILLYIHGMMGSPHLAMPRYFTPSLTAPALATAFALAVFYPRAPGGGPLPPAGGAWRFDLAGLVVAGLFLGYTTLAAVKHIVTAPDLVSRRLMTDLAPIADAPIPVVTNDPLLFIEYSYYREGQQRLMLLRGTPREVAGFRRFAPALPVIEPSALSAWPRFLYVSQDVVNAYPFDIDAWARARGGAVSGRGTLGEARLVEVRSGPAL